MIKSSFKLEQKLIRAGYDFVIGIDEAGRGPLAGPVVACACVLKCHAELVSASQKKPKKILKQVQNDKLLNLVRDSKTLSEKQREGLYNFILKNFHVGVGICDHKTIDRINILQATFLAMKKAVVNLNKNIKHCHSRGGGNLVYKTKIKNWILAFARMTNKSKIVILVDGNKIIPNLSIEQKAIVNGDKLVKSISAASIMAKVTRDRIMHKLHRKHPSYHFDKHKGYGTKLHTECLKKHGPCEIHRKSFRPVKMVDFKV